MSETLSKINLHTIIQTPVDPATSSFQALFFPFVSQAFAIVCYVAALALNQGKMTEHFNYLDSHTCHYAIPVSGLKEVFASPSSARISAIRSVKPEPKSHADRLKSLCNPLHAQVLILIVSVLDLFNMDAFGIWKPMSMFSRAGQRKADIMQDQATHRVADDRTCAVSTLPVFLGKYV